MLGFYNGSQNFYIAVILCCVKEKLPFCSEAGLQFQLHYVVIDRLQVTESSQHGPLCFLFSCDSDNNFVTLLRGQRVKDEAVHLAFSSGSYHLHTLCFSSFCALAMANCTHVTSSTILSFRALCVSHMRLEDLSSFMW